MKQEHFEHFYEDSQKHIERVRAVGSLNLVDTNRSGYILASIDVLNKDFGRSIFVDELEEILEDVVKYGLWDWADKKKEETPTSQPRSTAGLRRTIVETLAYLETNGLIDGILNVTDIGRKALTEIVVPHEPEVIESHRNPIEDTHFVEPTTFS